MLRVSAMSGFGRRATQVPPKFRFEVRTTGASEDFTLPLESSGDYDFVIDWGDGNESEITAYDDAAVTHTYATAGTYYCVVSGIITGWSFGAGVSSDAAKIYDISNLGPLRLGNSGQYFKNCVNMDITATDTLNLSGTTTLTQAFKNCDTIETSNFKFSNMDVTNTSYMFDGCSALRNWGKAGWDVSNVTNMAYMFNNCPSVNFNIISQFGSGWDLSSVTSFDHFLYGATAFSNFNYESMLIGLWMTNTNTGVPLLVSAQYEDGSFAADCRYTLINDRSWAITDNGIIF